MSTVERLCETTLSSRLRRLRHEDACAPPTQASLQLHIFNQQSHTPVLENDIRITFRCAAPCCQDIVVRQCATSPNTKQFGRRTSRYLSCRTAQSPTSHPYWAKYIMSSVFQHRAPAMISLLCKPPAPSSNITTISLQCLEQCHGHGNGSQYKTTLWAEKMTVLEGYYGTPGGQLKTACLFFIRALGDDDFMAPPAGQASIAFA